MLFLSNSGSFELRELSRERERERELEAVRNYTAGDVVHVPNVSQEEK